jgi:hypothetical protein
MEYVLVYALSCSDAAFMTAGGKNLANFYFSATKSFIFFAKVASFVGYAVPTVSGKRTIEASYHQLVLVQCG